MKHIYGYIVGAILCMFLGVVMTLWYQRIEEEVEQKQDVENANFVWRIDPFILTSENLYRELKAQGVEFPEIVVAQAILETGNYKSNACKDKNNLFGLRCYDGTYMYFDHWTDCVLAYKYYIQNWDTPPNDYYQYLKDLGYAEDSLYIQKLKKIVK